MMRPFETRKARTLGSNVLKTGFEWRHRRASHLRCILRLNVSRECGYCPSLPRVPPPVARVDAEPRDGVSEAQHSRMQNNLALLESRTE